MECAIAMILFTIVVFNHEIIAIIKAIKEDNKKVKSEFDK